MKKMIFLMAIFLSFASSSYAWTLKSGTYDVAGGNSDWGGTGYRGEVVIIPQGDTSKVIWRINGQQTQVGIGILQDDVFSVAFTDLSNAAFWGIASYRVGPWGDLEGRWCSFDQATTKPEVLKWRNYNTY